jgi:hypothetical protein
MVTINSVLSRVDKFLAEAVKKPMSAKGSLVFALDATATVNRRGIWLHTCRARCSRKSPRSGRSM